MSSLYGVGHVNALAAVNLAQVDNQKETTNQKELTTVLNMPVKLIITDVEAYVKQEYANTPILIEIARCESRFHQFNDDGTVVRGKTNREDIGVMQINEHYHADEALEKGFDIYGTEGNIAFAKYLYGKYGTNPWNYSSKCWNGGIAKK